jgi:HK97 family phage prohead protease
MDELEVRTINLTEIRVADDEEDEFSIRGTAAVYESFTDMGWYEEKIARGAFDATLAVDDIRSFFNHDENLVLGRNRSGTLRIEDREDGLHFAVNPPDTQYARDLKVSIKRGDVSGCSFMFITKVDTWDKTDPQYPKRTLNECKLFELGPVTIPAYPQTSVYARGMGLMAQLRNTQIPLGDEETRAMIENLERYLERGGPSTSQAAGDDENAGERVQVDLEKLRTKLKLARMRY